MFWRRDRRGEAGNGEDGKKDASSRPVRGEIDDDVEAELAADAEPAGLDEASDVPDDVFDDDAPNEDVDEAPDEGDEAGEGDDADETGATAASRAGRSDAEVAIDAEEMTPEEIEAQAREFMADNDTWMYGQNARAVIRLLDRLENVDPYKAETLLEAVKAFSKGEREIARKAIRRLAETDMDIERQVRLAREAVGNWLAVTTEDLRYQAMDVAWPRHAAQVGDAAIDAASALVVKNDIDEADFQTLHEPWQNAVAAWDEEARADKAGPDAIDAETPADETADSEEAAGEPKPGEFGPNTGEVKELLSRLWLLPPEQISQLVANWERTPRGKLQAAHTALRELVEEDADYRRQVKRAQEQLQPWLNTGRREETSAYLGRTGVADTRSAAGPALADAVAALVLGDLLDRPAAETLYSPWFKLVGAPALPEPDETATEDTTESEDGR